MGKVSRAEQRRRSAQSERGGKWLNSSNPVKRRVAALEATMRGGIDGFAQDIANMFENFKIIADAYDSQDVNTAALKSLLLKKGIITEDEFQEERQYFIKVLNDERARRQAELEKLQQEAAEEAEREAEMDAAVKEIEAQAADGSKVTPELRRMHKAAVEAGKAPEDPPEATRFSLS